MSSASRSHVSYRHGGRRSKPAGRKMAATSVVLVVIFAFAALSRYSLALNSTMDWSETETLFRVMEAMSTDRDWRAAGPDPCSSGSSWPGLECAPSRYSGAAGLVHVVRLDFGVPPNPMCKKGAAFPTEVFSLPQLQSLFFFNCFTAAKTSFSLPPAAPSYSSLQQLSLKSNPSLDGTIPAHISSVRRLQVLTLSQNNLYGAIPGDIGKLTSLVHLDLSYNLLTGGIPAQISSLKSLTGLDLSYNSLSGPIPPAIGDLTVLQKLDLSSNKLAGSIPESFQYLSSLSFFALSNNNVTGGFPSALQKLQNLQYFIMDDNPISAALPPEFGKLAKLQELRLANSGYSGTIPASFGSLINLTTLSLENNRLTGQIPPELAGLSRIYHLNLSRNLLTGAVPFDAGFLRRLGKNLDLSGNPGLCFDSAAQFEAKYNLGIANCGDIGADKSSSSSSRMKSSSASTPSRRAIIAPISGILCFWLLNLAGLCNLRDQNS